MTSPLAAGDRLRVKIVGKFEASVGGRPLPTLARKSRALIGLLLLARTPELPRARLAGVLWSEKGDHLAKQSLRTVLHEIQRSLGGLGYQHLNADHLAVTLAADQVDCDLWDLMAAAERGEVHPMLLARDRLIDQILNEVEDVDPAFTAELVTSRENIETRLLEAFDRRLPPEGAAEFPEAAEAAARAIARLAPHNERAARVLIRGRIAAGDTGAALAIYSALWKHLEDVYEVEPDELTQKLMAELRLGQPPTIAAPPPRSVPAAPRQSVRPAPLGLVQSRPSIAVLPFRAASPNLESHLTSGIVDNTIHALGALRELFVISRASTLHYNDPTPDIGAIGRELGVRYLLHGSVQRGGDRLRISTELTDTEAGEVVRTDQHNGSVDDVFLLQDQIAIDVVKSIAPQVRDRELKRAMRKPPQDMTAYQLVLLGYDQMCQLDYAQFASARNNFERAMVADPAYAPAYSYSSIWHMRRVAQEWSPDVKRDMELAAQLAERAMQIDPDDAFALAVYGYAKSFVEKQHAIGLQYLDLATTRYPNQPYAWIYKAAVLSFVNEADEAVRCAEVGLKLSPRDQFMWFAEAVCGQAYYSKGDMMKAVDLARRANAGAPRHRGNLRVLIAALVSLGQISEARTIARSVKFDLSAWAARTPLPEPLLTATVRRLHIAGLDAPAVA